MTWYAIYLKEDGSLYSLGSKLTEALPPEYAVKELAEKPDLEKVAWDTEKLDFLAAPPPPRDPMQDTMAVFAGLDESKLTQEQLLAQVVKALKFLVERELNRG